MPIGGGKGGSGFDPKGRSDAEVMRFCQSFMTGLYRHLGEHTDVPAGDIGVGAREIGYLFGQDKHITNRFEAGVLTGKGMSYGARASAPTPTRGRRPAAWRAAACGTSRATWRFPAPARTSCRSRQRSPLVKNGCRIVAEGANMPTTPEAVRVLQSAGVGFGPGKAANAGGVATSALEMQQNASRDRWTFQHTEDRLREIMRDIHARCHETAEEYGDPGNSCSAPTSPASCAWRRPCTPRAGEASPHRRPDRVQVPTAPRTTTPLRRSLSGPAAAVRSSRPGHLRDPVLVEVAGIEPASSGT